MKSVTSLTHNVKANTKCYGFWRKTSTAKTSKSVSQNILAYLDETTKADEKKQLIKEAVEGTRKWNYKDVAYGPAKPQLAGIDYLSKEEQGKVRVYGFLRDDITKLTGQYPHLLDNNTRILACHSAWMQKIGAKHARKFGHKYVLSLDPKFCELMAAGGKDVDALLVQTARTVLRRFQEKNYPGDRLGYLLGIHHDKQHIHAHILLYPYTESGKHLRITDSKGDFRFRDMRKMADKLIRDYFTKEFEYPIKASERPVDRVTQVRLIGLHLQDSFKKTGRPATDLHDWMAREQKRILALPEKEIRDILTNCYEAEGQRHQKLLSGLKDGKGPAFLQNIAERQTQFKHQLQQIYEREGHLKEQQVELKKQSLGAYASVANFKFFTAKAKGGGMGLTELGTTEQRAWLVQQLTNSPDVETFKKALAAKLPKTEQDLEWFNKVIDKMHQGGNFRFSKKEERKAEEQLIRTSQDFMRQVFMGRLDALKAERAKLKEEQDRVRRERDGLKIQLDCLKIVELEAQAAIKGRRPQFLEQYEGLKRAGIALPITCRSVTDSVMSTPVNIGERASEDLHRRLLNSLRQMQGEKVQGPLLEMDRYMRVVIDDSQEPDKKQERQQVQETNFRQRLETPGIRDFLVAPESKLPGTAPEKMERTVARRVADHEFSF